MTAVVNALVEEVGVTADIRVYPWARSYKTALETPNAFIFSIGRSDQREALFKWVGPVLEARHFLFSLKDRSDITLSSMADARGYRVGTIRNSIREQHLLTVADEFDLNIVSGSTVEGNFEQLRRGKIDLWAANSLVAAYTQLKVLGPGQDVLVPALRLTEIEAPYYIGFNSQFDDALLARFSAALDKLREDGTLDFIINRETVGLGLGLSAISK
jgi:polar amino acid transport system substrate-binding protein